MIFIKLILPDVCHGHFFGLDKNYYNSASWSFILSCFLRIPVIPQTFLSSMMMTSKKVCFVLAEQTWLADLHATA